MASGHESTVRRVLVVAAVLCAVNFSLAASPATDKTPSAEKIRVEAEDGVLIVGDYYSPARSAEKTAPIVILLHMEQSDRSAWKPLVPYLHAAGFAVMAIDLRGHGQSIEPKDLNLSRKAADRDSRLFRAMHKDVTAAYLWLAKQGRVDPARFAIVGAGVGCAVALDYASRDKSVDAVVCLSPGLSYPGLDAAAFIRKCESREILALATGADADAANELKRAGGETSVKVVTLSGPGGESTSIRGTGMLGGAAEAERAIGAFFERAFGRAGTDVVVASINSDIYHVPDTSHARRIKDENRRWFSSADEAESRGLRAVKTRSSRSSGGARQASPRPTAPPPTDRQNQSGARTGYGR